MRTLMTQMRLRRTIQTFGQGLEALEDGPHSQDHLQAVSRQVLNRLGAVREAWQQEAAATEGTVQPGLRRYVATKLVGLGELAAELALPGENLGRIEGEFRDQALTLILALRGLEDSSSDELTGWFGSQAGFLRRSA